MTRSTAHRSLVQSRTANAILTAIVIALVVVAWLKHRTAQSAEQAAAELRSDRNRLCRDLHSQLQRLEAELPRYEQFVREWYRPDAVESEPYHLLRASQLGLYDGLRHCLRSKDDREGDDARLTVLRNFRGSDTVQQSRELIAELMSLLEARYKITHVSGVTSDGVE